MNDIESLGYIFIYLLQGFLKWDNFRNDICELSNKKLSISLDDFCQYHPFNIKSFIDYSWNLKNEQKPDYNFKKFY